MRKYLLKVYDFCLYKEFNSLTFCMNFINKLKESYDKEFDYSIMEIKTLIDTCGKEDKND